jgi:NADH-quinone oxidoreductase subunit N
VSVVVGTLFAIAQNDLKRMLAYSGVAHAGFILMAVVAGVDGIPGMWFYVGTYAFQLVGAFAIVTVVSGSTADRSPFESYVGLGSRSPFLAMMLALFMLAMGGIPFTAGFIGKVSVFAPVIEAGYLWLAIVGVVTSVAGLFFYLRVIVLMFFQEPVLAEAPGTATAPPEVRPGLRTVIALAAAVTILLGLYPWPILEVLDLALPL